MYSPFHIILISYTPRNSASLSDCMSQQCWSKSWCILHVLLHSVLHWYAVFKPAWQCQGRSDQRQALLKWLSLEIFVFCITIVMAFSATILPPYFIPFAFDIYSYSINITIFFLSFLIMWHPGLNWCSRWRGSCWAFHPPLSPLPYSPLPTCNLSSLAMSISKAWSICMTSYSKLCEHIVMGIQSIVFYVLVICHI